MWLMWAVGCDSYELVAAETTIRVAPVTGDVGAFFDATVPMRLELYGPEVDDGRLTWKPYFGYIRTPVEAEVECLEGVVLEASTANDQLAIFFTREELDSTGTNYRYEGMVNGGDFTNGGTSNGSEGHAEDVLSFDFPCLPNDIPHNVTLDWVVDRSAPVPYTDVY